MESVNIGSVEYILKFPLNQTFFINALFIGNSNKALSWSCDYKQNSLVYAENLPHFKFIKLCLGLLNANTYNNSKKSFRKIVVIVEKGLQQNSKCFLAPFQRLTYFSILEFNLGALRFNYSVSLFSNKFIQELFCFFVKNWSKAGTF